MVKKLLVLASIVAMVLVLPAFNFVKANDEAGFTAPTSEVVAEAETEVAEGILKARFENMLSVNYLYGEDFESDRTVIENSILPLLEKSVEGQISKDLVLNFIANMYGRQVDPTACYYEFAPADEGMFTVLPRGYSEYSHEITSITENEGGYTVLSDTVINPHDSQPENVKVKTVFVPNEGSSFGFNIVSCEIL